MTDVRMALERLVQTWQAVEAYANTDEYANYKTAVWFTREMSEHRQAVEAAEQALAAPPPSGPPDDVHRRLFPDGRMCASCGLGWCICGAERWVSVSPPSGPDWRADSQEWRAPLAAKLQDCHEPIEGICRPVRCSELLDVIAPFITAAHAAGVAERIDEMDMVKDGVCLACGTDLSHDCYAAGVAAERERVIEMMLNADGPTDAEILEQVFTALRAAPPGEETKP